MAVPPPAQRWLIRGVNWLGDAVMTTPALARIRQAHPTAHLTLLTPAKLEDLWQGHPAVDTVMASPPGTGIWGISRMLRRGQFDLALILPNSHRSALEAWLAGIRLRVGVARPGRNWLLTQAVPPPREAVPMRRRSEAEVRALVAGKARRTRERPPPRAHHLHHYLRLAEALGGNGKPLAPFIPVEAARQRATFERLGLEPGGPSSVPWLGLNAGAEFGPAKRWPTDRFVATAAEVQRRISCRWLILGGPGDRELGQQIADSIMQARTGAKAGAAEGGGNVRVLAGRTTLRETAEVMAACRLVLTNDTGPMHLAAAVGTRVVALFGSTDPALTAPGLPGDAAYPHRLLLGEAACAPCFRRQCPVDLRCLRSLTVERVVEAVVGVAGSGLTTH